MDAGFEEKSVLETLARGLAHEIRTPLNVIAINVRMMRELVDGLERAEKSKLETICGRLERQVEHIATLLERFLDFARPGELELRPQSVRELLEAVADTVAEDARRRRVDVEVSAPSDLVIRVDGPRFTQALLNLAGNALEAMKDGGRLALQASCENDSVRIQVRDTGPGIPPEVRQKVFDLFFSTKEKGTGLGLPIVQRTIHDHGACIELSETGSQGTVFTITIPRWKRGLSGPKNRRGKKAAGSG